MAQAPWSPIHFGKVYNYENCITYQNQYIYYENYLSTNVDLCYRAIVIDSVIAQGSDTIYVIHKTPTPNTDSTITCYGYLGLSSTVHPWNYDKTLFTQKKIIKRSNNDYIFQYPDTFLLRPLANLNDSWLFDSSGTGITATVIAIQASTLWGQADSIKTILLSNNDTIRLSRNYGILKFPDFENSGHSYQLAGLKWDSISFGVDMPDFWNFYNFELGDEFMYLSTYYFPIGMFGGGPYNTTYKYIKVRITWKNRTSNGFDYGIEAFNSNTLSSHYALNFPIPNNLTHFIDTVSFSYNSSGLNSFLFDIDSTQYSTILTIVNMDTSNLLSKRLVPLYYNIQDSCFYNDFNDHTNYLQGLGAVFNKYSNEPVTGSCELIGYIKNGITHGTVYSDSLMIQLLPIEQIQENSFSIRLAPNPSPAGHAQLLFDAALNAPIDLEIYNTMGQLVASRQTVGNETSLTLDYPELPKGLYLIRLKSNEKEQILKWLIP